VAAAAGAAVAAVAAGAGKDKSTNVKGNEYPSFFVTQSWMVICIQT
jgi:hypothetical protein